MLQSCSVACPKDRVVAGRADSTTDRMGKGPLRGASLRQGRRHRPRHRLLRRPAFLRACRVVRLRTLSRALSRGRVLGLVGPRHYSLEAAYFRCWRYCLEASLHRVRVRDSGRRRR